MAAKATQHPWQRFASLVHKGALLSSWYGGVLDVTDRLPVAVRFFAGPQVSFKVVTRRKPIGANQKKMVHK